MSAAGESRRLQKQANRVMTHQPAENSDAAYSEARTGMILEYLCITNVTANSPMRHKGHFI
jgi:hypothetical protein